MKPRAMVVEVLSYIHGVFFMPSKSTLMTIVWTVAALALINRVPQARQILGS